MKLVIIDREDTMSGCWLADSKYPKMDRKFVHQEFAAGYGEVVRHLCSNYRCINPMHLVRGSVAENNEDERDKRRFFSQLIEGGVLDKTDIDNETTEIYLEGLWRIAFKKLMILGIHRTYLGDRIIKDQTIKAATLMYGLKFNRKIEVLEV